MRKSPILGLAGILASPLMFSGCANDRVVGGSALEVLGTYSRDARAGQALGLIGSNVVQSGVAQERRSQVNVYNQQPRVVERARDPPQIIKNDYSITANDVMDDLNKNIEIDLAECENPGKTRFTSNEKISFIMQVFNKKGKTLNFDLRNAEGESILKKVNPVTSTIYGVIHTYAPGKLKEGSYTGFWSIGDNVVAKDSITVE